MRLFLYQDAWWAWWDSNPHAPEDTEVVVLRVYQFRHKPTKCILYEQKPNIKHERLCNIYSIYKVKS